VTLLDVYDYYITPDEYAEAEKNGISRKCLEHRIRGGAWAKKKAITAPKGAYIVRSHLNVVLKAYGISYKQFTGRIYCGWDEWSAATVPIRNKEEHRELALWLCELKRKYPREMIELAARNGISAGAFRYRVRSGWSYELASTLPPSPLNASMILKQKYGDDYFKNYVRDIKKWLFVKIRK
jgi:hypothetical protein